MGFKPDIPPPCGQSWHISNDHQLRQCPVSFRSFAGPGLCSIAVQISCFCVRCRLSCSCATASCWTSGSCRPISPTSWRAPWCTTLAIAHKCGASSATCSCTLGKNSVARWKRYRGLWAEPFRLSPSLFSVQFGAAGLQRFAAAHDRRSFGDGSWHRTDQSPVHGRSACWWGSSKMHIS